MRVPDITALLAPTWRERAHAEQALRSWIYEYESEGGEWPEPWPEPVQAAIRALQPTPEAFLRALAVFWADVAARAYENRMRGYRCEGDSVWPPLDPEGPTRAFPMHPPTMPVRGLGMHGLDAWAFIARIGPWAAAIEDVIVDALDHPEPAVRDQAERSLAGIPAIGDERYRRVLAVADRWGSDGMVGARAFSIARHTDVARLPRLIDDLSPSLPEMAQRARFAILRALRGDPGRCALHALCARIDMPWADSGESGVLYAIDALCVALEIDPATIEGLMPAVCARAASEGVQTRSAAAAFLARHAGPRDRLRALAHDPHPWVRGGLAYGLSARSDVDPDLVRILAGNSLGDDTGYDGQPHDGIVALLLHAPAAAAQAMPEILAWWERSTAERWNAREPVEQALDLYEALAPHVDVGGMLPGFERELASLTAVEDDVELPAIDQPGAVRIIRNALEADWSRAGIDPAQAAAAADLQEPLLHLVAAALANPRADENDPDRLPMDADDDECARIECAESESGENETSEAIDHCEDSDWQDEPDALVERLRAAIAALRG